MNIVVLAAGTSTEREVSISSGSNVCRALRKKGHNAILVDVFFGENDLNIFELSKNNYDVEKVVDEMTKNSKKIEECVRNSKEFIGKNVIELCKKAEIVFMALHGSNGEDGRLQATFDLLGIKYTGSGHLGSAVAMDKSITKSILKSSNIPVVNGVIVNESNKAFSIEELDVKLPCVVKPACGGSSVGVFKCSNKEEYNKYLKEALSYEDTIVVEEFIKGREFSIGIIDNKALPIIEIIVNEGGFYDYENKYNGKTKEVCPANLEENIAKKMQQYAVAAAKALNLQAYARIDFLLDGNNNMFCLEANTLPGMTPTSLLPQEANAVGINYEELCDKLVNISLMKY